MAASKGLALSLALAVTGCAGIQSFPYDSRTTVDLSRKNYRVVKANAVGEDTGFNLLGVIPIVPVTYTDAMTDLYGRSEVKEGSAFALANVTKDVSVLYLILFSLPRLTIRADIIEFTDEPPSGQAP